MKEPRLADKALTAADGDPELALLCAVTAAKLLRPALYRAMLNRERRKLLKEAA